ncbi:MAG: HAMP domain-containing histidine kinase [Candidatus Brocadiaceae bacterium]|nr:HAMP domain-containing histidine kinase [Candidatus Brocadiaceae bacterium]
MRDESIHPLQTRFFYVGSIFAISLGLACLMWRFRDVNLILIAFGLTWAVLVTALTWEVVTRAARLQAMVRSRTYALERSNGDWAALLDQWKAFHTISSEINQKTGADEIAQTFAHRLCTSLPGVDGAWVWLEPGLLPDGGGGASAGEGFALAARCGPDFGMPEPLCVLRPDNPLTSRCFEAPGVTMGHHLALRARAWGWPWLEAARMESFAGMRLELDGRLLGVLGLFSRRTLTVEFVSRLDLSVNQLTVALEKARLLREAAGRADELAAMDDELGRLGAMRDWLVSSAGRDLRGPLANIRSIGEILEHCEDLAGQERREFGRVIRHESGQVCGLLADMVDLARIAAGDLALAPHTLDLAGVVARCCESFAPEAEERGIVLETTVSGAVPAHADGQAVGRVLNNLLANALKFTPGGGRIRVALDVLGGSDEPLDAVVRVSDTGVGIAPGEQARIFDLFAQVAAESGERPAGAGIGLAICREIVEASGGRIWVDSRPGDGSTFAFTLPLGAAAAAAARRVA